MRSLRILGCAAVALQACTTVAPPAPLPQVMEGLGVVVIVPAQSPPSSNFSTFAKGAPAGAVKGAAAFGGITAGAVLATAPAMGPYAPLGYALGLIVVAAEAAAGAVAGSIWAVPEATAAQVQAVMDDAVSKLDAQRAFAAKLNTITGIALRADPLRTAADTLLELRITEIGFETCAPEFLRSATRGCPYDPKKPVMALYMLAEARLVRAADGAELHARHFRYASPRRLLARWAGDDARLLAQEIESAYRELAERVNDEILLASRLELPVQESFASWPGSRNYGNCWLNPLEPAPLPAPLSEIPDRIVEQFKSPGSRTSDVCPGAVLHFPGVSELDPTLRWENFPRALDREKLDPAALGKIGEVSYDLKVWEVESCERSRLVYERTGLGASEHRLEEKLSPQARYYWTVRARFRYEGAAMVTRWAFFDPVSCYPNDITDWQYHRFVTPP